MGMVVVVPVVFTPGDHYWWGPQKHRGKVLLPLLLSLSRRWDRGDVTPPWYWVGATARGSPKMCKQCLKWEWELCRSQNTILIPFSLHCWGPSQRGVMGLA